MNDLISRKALGERIKALRHQIASRAAGFVDEDSYECGAVDGLYDALTYTMEAPSVPAVPLGMLCEWLGKQKAAVPCAYCENFDHNCEANHMMPCPNTADDWLKVLIEWMKEEGLWTE